MRGNMAGCPARTASYRFAVQRVFATTQRRASNAQGRNLLAAALPALLAAHRVLLHRPLLRNRYSPGRSVWLVMLVFVRTARTLPRGWLANAVKLASRLRRAGRRSALRGKRNPRGRRRLLPRLAAALPPATAAVRRRGRVRRRLVALLPLRPCRRGAATRRTSRQCCSPTGTSGYLATLAKVDASIILLLSFSTETCGNGRSSSKRFWRTCVLVTSPCGTPLSSAVCFPR
jgi:hypothetical protein